LEVEEEEITVILTYLHGRCLLKGYFAVDWGFIPVSQGSGGDGC
jgi:hypothetical protein